jgi:hypothetical protein
MLVNSIIQLDSLSWRGEESLLKQAGERLLLEYSLTLALSPEGRGKLYGYK